MDNLCHRCNSEVAPGTLFCPKCGAPQIRVATAPEPQPNPVHDQSTSGQFISSVDHPRGAIKWSSALPKTAISGIVTIVLLNIVVAITQLPVLALLVLPIGGALSVFLYSRGRDNAPLTPGEGARLGAVTGLFSFLIFACIVAVEMIYQRAELLGIVQKALRDAAANNSNPQAEAMVQQLMTPAGIATILTLSAIMFLFAFLLLSSLGGSAGAAMVRNTRADRD